MSASRMICVGRLVAVGAEGDADAGAGGRLPCRPAGTGCAARCWMRSARSTASRSRADVLEQDRELVAAQPRETSVGPQHRTCRRRGQVHQELVARLVAERVVDQLEAVEVEVHHREALLRVARQRAIARGQLLVEVHAVGQLRQVVVIGDVVELGFRAAPRGDVLRLHDQVMGRELPVARERDVERHPHVGAVAVQPAQLRVRRFASSSSTSFATSAAQVLQVVGVHELADVGREQVRVRCARACRRTPCWPG